MENKIRTRGNSDMRACEKSVPRRWIENEEKKKRRASHANLAEGKEGKKQRTPEPQRAE